MKVAIYGKKITSDSRGHLEKLYDKLDGAGVGICVNDKFNHFLRDHCDLNLGFNTYDSHESFKKQNPDLLLTIGGDGTLLDSTTYVRDTGVPILGINTGRLGFLANVAKSEVEEAAEAILNKNYVYDKRTLLSAESKSLNFKPNFALNEVTVSRKDTTAMITVHVKINGEYLNSYWADGLILATP
ncbi:MAG: NAD(+)/NADH kinase, partial [Schleiferiaceae bacterium]|nr:NAD(+)/NADH kinase [Schleiferiaceae bacterium]